jgi:hypothetical protein
MVLQPASAMNAVAIASARTPFSMGHPFMGVLRIVAPVKEVASPLQPPGGKPGRKDPMG